MCVDHFNIFRYVMSCLSTGLTDGFNKLLDIRLRQMLYLSCYLKLIFSQLSKTYIDINGCNFSFLFIMGQRNTKF